MRCGNDRSYQVQCLEGVASDSVDAGVHVVAAGSCIVQVVWIDAEQHYGLTIQRSMIGIDVSRDSVRPTRIQGGKSTVFNGKGRAGDGTAYLQAVRHG